MNSLALLVALALPAADPDAVPGRIQGRVLDALAGAPAPGIVVRLVDRERWTTTDENGRFSFEAVPPGAHTLRAGDPPYQTAEIEVAVRRGAATPPVEIAIAPLVETVEIVEIARREAPAPGGTQVVRDEVTHVPGARGDMLTAVQSLPGIANTGTFGPASGGLIIRGSAIGDSRILVDGWEIPVLYHFGAVQSIIPSEMIESIDYLPGGFGVEKGRATGGVVEVHSRRGRPEWGGFAEMSFINGGMFLQGPIGGSKGARRATFAVSLRRSFVDAILPAVVPPGADLGFTVVPRYYDYQARIDWQPRDRWRLALFVFGTDDAAKIETGADNDADPLLTGTFENETTFTRAIASATYTGPVVRQRVSASADTGSFFFRAGPDRYLEFHVQGLGLRDETRVGIGDRLTLSAGGQVEVVWTENDVQFPRPPKEGDPRDPSFTFDPPIMYHEDFPVAAIEAWTAAEIRVKPWLDVTAGIRYDGYFRNDDHVIEPRGSARAKVGARTALRGSTGLYTRPAWFQDELIQRSLGPERALQSTLGIEHELREGLTVQGTAFETERRDLIVYDTDRKDASKTLDAYVNRGTGRTFGAEILVQWRGPRHFGWLAYTLSRSLRRDAPDRPERLFDFDQTHNLILVGSAKLDRAQKWQIGGRFQFTTGRPYTPVVGSIYQSDLNYYQPLFGGLNSQRLESQHQLDLRLDRVWRFSTWRLSAFVDVTNVYLHAAVLQYQYSYDYSQKQAIRTIPILPSLGVRGEW